MDTAAQVILIKHIVISQFIIKTYNQFKHTQYKLWFGGGGDAAEITKCLTTVNIGRAFDCIHMFVHRCSIL